MLSACPPPGAGSTGTHLPRPFRSMLATNFFTDDPAPNVGAARLFYKLLHKDVRFEPA